MCLVCVFGVWGCVCGLVCVYLFVKFLCPKRKHLLVSLPFLAYFAFTKTTGGATFDTLS